MWFSGLIPFFVSIASTLPIRWCYLHLHFHYFSPDPIQTPSLESIGTLMSVPSQRNGDLNLWLVFIVPQTKIKISYNYIETLYVFMICYLVFVVICDSRLFYMYLFVPPEYSYLKLTEKFLYLIGSPLRFFYSLHRIVRILWHRVISFF